MVLSLSQIYSQIFMAKSQRKLMGVMKEKWSHTDHTDYGSWVRRTWQVHFSLLQCRSEIFPNLN